MPPPKIVMSINVKKISKEHLKTVAEDKVYLNCAFFAYKDGPNERNDDGFIKQEISKEARDRGEQGAIIGNWAYLETKRKPKQSDENAPPF